MVDAADPSWVFYSMQQGTGEVLGRLPLNNVSFTRRISALDTAEGSLPVEHAKATRDLLRPSDKELAICRVVGGVETPYFNGPIVFARGGVSGQVTIQAASPMWYMSRRTVELTKRYADRDPLDIVRELITHARGKTGGAIYRFTVSANTTAYQKDYDIFAKERRYVLDVISDLADDPTTGFDWRVNYGMNSRREISRSLSLGAPSIGSTLTNYELSLEAGLSDCWVEEGLDRAGNRVHMLGGGNLSPVTVQNTSSLNAGQALIEYVDNRSDVTKLKTLQGQANESRRLRIPPTTHYGASFTPSAALPYDFYSLGDTVKLRVAKGYVSVNANQRIVEATTRVHDTGGVDGKGDCSVELVFNDVLSNLGA